MNNHEKKWIERGGQVGDIYKWEKFGQCLEGLWRGTRPGKYGDLGTLETEGGTVTFPVHTALALLVKGLEEGSEIRIEYHGKRKNENTGREFKDFKLFVAEDHGDPRPSDDDIPF